MGFINVSPVKRRKATGTPGGPTSDGYGMLPIIGVADWYAPRNSDTINSLRNVQRGNYAGSPLTTVAPFKAGGVFFVPPFSVDMGYGNDAMWIAYPAVYGEVQWQELDSNYNDYPFSADLNGAKGDPTDPAKWGPLEVDVVIDGVTIPMYVYINDWPGIGTLHYRTK